MGIEAEELQYEIAPELQEELRKHPGKWALITRSRLLALGDSAAEAVEKGRDVEPGAESILKRIPANNGVIRVY